MVGWLARWGAIGPCTIGGAGQGGLKGPKHFSIYGNIFLVTFI